jgi:ABC-type multidrug transport system ATPase subunit
MRQIIYPIRVFLIHLVIILDHGKIKAKGTSHQLKEEHGQFFQLEMFQNLEKMNRDIDFAIEWVLNSIPDSGIISSTSSSLSVRIPQDQLERLNDFLELVGKEGFFRWTVKSSTIEDVFLALCSTKKGVMKGVDGPLLDYITFCQNNEYKEQEKQALQPPEFEWVKEMVKNQFNVVLYHTRFIILNDSVITFIFFLLQFVLVLVAVPNALGLFGFDESPPDLSGLAVFSMMLISPRFAMIMHDERVSGCLNLLKIDGMNTKMYWSAQLVAGFVFTLFTQPLPLVNFLIFGFKVLDLFLPFFLLLGTFVALSISFIVSALYKDRISTASVLLMLFVFSNIALYHPLVCLFPLWGLRYTLYEWNNGDDQTYWLFALFTLGSSIFYIILGIGLVEWRHVVKHFSKKSSKTLKDVCNTEVQIENLDESVLREFKETVDSEMIQPDEAIRLVQIYKKYGSKTVVNNLTLRILQKESFGLLGPNGAGKSTILKMLCEQEWPSNGLLQVTQNQQGGIPMGVCQQENIFWEYLTVRGNLEFISQLFGVPEEHVEKWVKYVCSVSLIENSMLDKFPIELSGGMKRRLAIGLALAGNPRILILDEPTAGVDPKNKRMIWNALDTIRNDPERCLLITSHFMDEVEHLCDRIAIIKTGVLTVLGTKEQLKLKFGNALRFPILIQNSNPMNDFDGLQEVLHKLVGKDVGVCDVLTRKVGSKYYHGCTFLLQTSDSGILLQNLQDLVQSLELVAFAIGETSMEDVFRNVILGS